MDVQSYQDVEHIPPHNCWGILGMPLPVPSNNLEISLKHAFKQPHRVMQLCTSCIQFPNWCTLDPRLFFAVRRLNFTRSCLESGVTQILCPKSLQLAIAICLMGEKLEATMIFVYFKLKVMMILFHAQGPNVKLLNGCVV